MENKWKLIYINRELQETILNLPRGILSQYLHVADILLKYGPDIEIDYIFPIKNDIFAINIENGKNFTRIYCSKLVKYRIAVLHCCVGEAEEEIMDTIKIVEEKLKEVE